MGEVAMIPDGLDCCLGQRMVLLRPNRELCDGNYLLYAMLSEYVQTQIQWNDASGSIVSNLCIPDLSALKIPYYELDRQRKIGAMLAAIDGKIDSNKKLMKELEGTSRLIYDYWFTQFDYPDKNCKPYRTSGGKMVWSDGLKHQVPEGWEVRQLGDICDTRLGGTPDTEVAEYWGGTMPWLNSAEVAVSPILMAEKRITELGQKESATSFAPAGSILLSITRYIRPSILEIDACFNQSVVAVLENETLRMPFLFPFIQSQISRYMMLRTGAQQPHINKETVDSTWMVVPTRDILDRYYVLTKPMYDQLVIAAKQNLELSRMRDWLLPMLMNGQVTIGE